MAFVHVLAGMTHPRAVKGNNQERRQWQREVRVEVKAACLNSFMLELL